MFIFELFIYVCFAWIMYHFARKSLKINGENGKMDFYLWAYMLFFTIISAIRWRVGVDSEAYIEIFRTGDVRDSSNEYIWNALVHFVHDWGLHFTLGTGLAAFFQIFCLTESLKKYKYILVLLPVVLFGGRYFLDLMNGVRQMMVACGFLYLSKYIVERKPWSFAIGIIVLSGIHHSALILLPTYLLTYVSLSNLSDKRILCLALFFICFAMGQTPSFQGLIQLIQPVVTSTGYENYSEYYLASLSGKSSETLSMGPMMISFLLSSLAVIWFAPLLKEKFAGEIPCFNLWYFFSFLFSCGYFLFCNTGHMMIRPFQYFEFYLVIMMTLLLYYFHQNGHKLKFYCLAFIICVCTLTNVYKNTGQPIEFVLYKTYFERLK